MYLANTVLKETSITCHLSTLKLSNDGLPFLLRHPVDGLPAEITSFQA